MTGASPIKVMMMMMMMMMIDDDDDDDDDHFICIHTQNIPIKIRERCQMNFLYGEQNHNKFLTSFSRISLHPCHP